MKNQQKPNLLVLTSSFPNEPDDETCGYIRDHARWLSSEFTVQVLAPDDRRARDWPADQFVLVRSKSWLPSRIDPLQATCDFNDLLSRNLAIKFLSLISLLVFAKDAFRRALDADAICSHWLMPSGFIGAIISRLLGKPHVVIEHSGAAHLLMRMRFGRTIARFIVSGSDRIVTVSEDLKKKFLSLCPEAADKVEVVPMGSSIPLVVESPVSEPAGDVPALQIDETLSRRRLILFLGRLSEVKGADVLIKAIAELNDVCLLIGGDGERRCELEMLARQLSVKALFLGRVNSARRAELFSRCDAVVIPSIALSNGRTEGTPVVCLESMAAGIPVIASRVGGLAEMIVDGHNGSLFEPGDHQALAEMLKRVLADPELRQKLSTNARQTAERHRWSLIAPRFNQVIRESLTNNGGIADNRKLEPRSARC